MQKQIEREKIWKEDRSTQVQADNTFVHPVSGDLSNRYMPEGVVRLCVERFNDFRMLMGTTTMMTTIAVKMKKGSTQQMTMSSTHPQGRVTRLHIIPGRPHIHSGHPRAVILLQVDNLAWMGSLALLVRILSQASSWPQRLVQSIPTVQIQV